jgi:polyisoprenyl-teichoic acid--peptidoglycan teichoic acid transferase
MRAKLPLILSLVAGLVMAAFVWIYQNNQVQSYAQGIVNEPEEVLPTTNNRTNVALLGIGGEGHEGGKLTDSILVASIAHNTQNITLISIPRDVWVESLKSKINAIYYFAEQKAAGSGLSQTKAAIELVVGLPIHHALLIDFSGFIKAIDVVGGIEVTVDQTFDDYKYPIPGKENAEPESERYEHVHFEAGTTRMDGVTALKYVRSRHAEGDEGTDFARGKRQQKVIRAFVSSLISTKTVVNPERIITLKSTLRDSIKTDIVETHVSAYTKLGLTSNESAIKNLSITDLLYNPSNQARYGGAWVLIPRYSWEDVHGYVHQNLQ